ncbi:hypothetical protein WBJ53_07285 [Spirosoma sp. SC4-14]|uniref:hypothetical protein n=1 Tax=Spirosoma sp. SC4-14 TaxID=3128900 RepID=UPI0030CA7495
MKVFLFLLFFSIDALANNFYSISGRLDDRSIRFLYLYKFENLFSRKLVYRIPVIDGNFYYAASLEETDAYQLQNPANKYTIIFVWDNNIIFDINAESFTDSVVKNSSLTKELRSFDSTRIAQFIEPVRRLDTLLTLIDSRNYYYIQLKNKRDSTFNACQKGYALYGVNYIKNHPDSFISLLQITYCATVFVSDEDRKLIQSLSERLRKHSRARKVLGG